VSSVNGKQFLKQCLTDDLQQEHWRQSLEERGPPAGTLKAELRGERPS